ncbi:MAG: phosphoketolase family protein [Candidatus Calescibacterium sp.]|nr:phosphoketolase family protein [Candidatus Calescibacterium sp.]MDW8132674.1 phosphoketolase family protein [Candidatus Calescibacterium sp.]
MLIKEKIDENLLDYFFKACCYIAVGMIYLKDNPLLKEPLKFEHIKDRLLGHWGASPTISFVYTHTNRIVKEYDIECMIVVGPGHGAPGYIAPLYLEGTLSKYYPNFSQDEEGLKSLFRAFSFPGGLGSHCTPELPGTIQEGGELGYTLSHSFGAVFDNPNLIVISIIGDGEAETGPLSASWHSNKFINPVTDGVVIPILSLNGYKINNPTILSRIENKELMDLFKGYGYDPIIVEYNENIHQHMSQAMDFCIEKIKNLWEEARSKNKPFYVKLPMIILKVPKGWTAPKKFKNHFIEGYWRSHQVPLQNCKTSEEELKMLEEWLKSYEPENIFDSSGKLKDTIKKVIPDKKIGENIYSNGGKIRKPLKLPEIKKYGIDLEKPCKTNVSNTQNLGVYLADIIRENRDNFRVFGPDETASNRLSKVFEFGKTWMLQKLQEDEDEGYLESFGRTMEILSEHTIEGWLEGYLLTGRHGILNTYEGFAPIISSMVNQFGKWLDISLDVPWREPISSLNILLTSVVWRQDHNGFTHQDPGFINSIVDKWPEIVRVYFPCDSNTLIACIHSCLQTTNRINIIICDKQVHPQYLTIDQAFNHFIKGIGIFDFLSDEKEPDVILASCGDIPTKENVFARSILKQLFPEINIRFINISNLFRLAPENEHPDGLKDDIFDMYFTEDKPIIFNFHGYPWLIHRLTYRRKNHKNLHVRGYRENRKTGIDAFHLVPFLKGRGGITTPLQLAIINQVDRFSIAIDAIKRIEKLKLKGAKYVDLLKNKQIEALKFAYENGVDNPDYEDIFDFKLW